MASRLGFEFTGDANGIVGALREIERRSREINDVQRALHKTTKRVHSAGNEWLREWKKRMLDLPIKAVGRGIGSLTRKLVDARSSAIESARAQEKQVRRLETAMTAANVPLEKGMKWAGRFTRQLQDMTNVGDDVAQGLLSGFLPLLDGSVEKKLRQAGRLTTLTANLAAQSGQNVESVKTFLQNVVSKGEFMEGTRFGLSGSEVERAKAMKAQGQDARQYVLNRLAAKSAGAAARERQLDPGKALANEIGDIVENVGGLLMTLQNQYLEPLIEPMRGINTALEGADLVETAKNIGEQFTSGQLKKNFEPTINLAKQVGEGLLTGLKSVVEAGWETLKEVMRYGGLQIEDGIVKALRNVPGMGGVRSSLERQGGMIAEARGGVFRDVRAGLGGAAGFGATTAQQQAARDRAMRNVKYYERMIAQGINPTEATARLAERRGMDAKAREIRNLSTMHEFRGDAAMAALNRGGAAFGGAISQASELPAVALGDGHASVSQAVVKKDPAEDSGAMYLARLTYGSTGPGI